MSKVWGFQKIWNESLDINRQKEVERRDHIWASELGGSFYDRYWRMKGRQPTTPPNLRARRKFEAGHLIEWTIKQVLARAGILRASQKHITYDNGSLKVTGRCDFIAGGQIQDVNLSDLPETFGMIAEATLAQLKQAHPAGLREVILEVKSCSGLMFDKYEQAPQTSHALQAFHYAHGLRKPAILIYISRDDLRVCEWVIMPNSAKWKMLYENDIEVMAEFLKLYEDDIGQYREPLLLWEDYKFKKNWKVEYSNYLTDYGFNRPDEYSDAAKITTRLNNVVKSIRAGKKLMKLNLEAIDIGRTFYPPVETMIKVLMEEQYV